MAVPSLKSLTELHALGTFSEGSSAGFARSSANAHHNDRLYVVRTDITTLSVDAIVNAANESLLGGGGVDGAIHNAAGPDLYRECRGLNGCDTGDAKITAGYDLPARHVIHAVGPVYHSYDVDQSASLLSSCYRRSLQLAVENNLTSIAFSALSTGIYGYPSLDAAHVACRTIRAFLDDPNSGGSRLKAIVICNFLPKDEKAYEETLPQYFPAASATQE